MMFVCLHEKLQRINLIGKYTSKIEKDSFNEQKSISCFCSLHKDHVFSIGGHVLMMMCIVIYCGIIFCLTPTTLFSTKHYF